MEFRIEERKHKHADKYQKDELDIAYDFSKKALKELKDFLKAIVLFGSLAKKHKNPHRKGMKANDIDILLIVNDVSMVITPEVEEAYRIILLNMVKSTSERIHVTTMMFSNYWELVKAGDPIVINMLRDGVPLIDHGIVEPMQALLFQGRIRPTWESIWNYYSRAPQTLFNSKQHIKQAVIDLYWAVIDSAHAALMKKGYIPPSPSHVADMLEEKLFPMGLVTKRHVGVMRNLYSLSKQIMKGDVKEISGAEFDSLHKDAEEFVHAMKRIVEHK